MQNRRGNMPTEAGFSFLFNNRSRATRLSCARHALKKQSWFAGPSTSTVVTGFTVNGQLNDEPSNVPVTAFGRCDRGRFEVVNPGSVPVPVICGENSGEHSTYCMSFSRPWPQFYIRMMDGFIFPGRDTFPIMLLPPASQQIFSYLRSLLI